MVIIPIIYLSPSLQEGNMYINGGSEEYWMNRLADAMVPYLRASGIQYTRNEPWMTLSQAIAQSNAGNYDLHLALHSNAAPENLSGRLQGTDVYYYINSPEGKRAADIIADNFKEIYPNPSKVRAVPTATLAELRRTRAPSVLIETAYHDNLEDAQWIQNNLDIIAANIVRSLTEYFDIPFILPQEVRQGTVTTSGGNLNLRSKPSIFASVKAQIPNGARVTVFSEYEDWYVVGYNNIVGYASKRYITV